MMESARNVFAEMNAKSTPFAICENLKITSGLRGFYHPERIVLAGDGEIFRFLARNLQEHTGVRAAFISLTCTMQKSRTKTHHSSHLLRLQDRLPHLLQFLVILRKHRDV